MSLATRQTVERALAAFIATATRGGQSLADFPGRFTGEPENMSHALTVHAMPGAVGEDGALPAEWERLQLPALVVASVRSQPHAIGYDLCDVALTFITTPEEIDAPRKVQQRAGWLSAVFDEDQLDTITAALNAPLSGPDTRAVRGLTVIGIERDGEEHTNNGMHLMDTVRLRVHASGDGV